MLTLDEAWIVVQIGTDIKDWPLFVSRGMKDDETPSKVSTNASVS
jgi:hypothetical protein